MSHWVAWEPWCVFFFDFSRFVVRHQKSEPFNGCAYGEWKMLLTHKMVHFSE